MWKSPDAACAHAGQNPRLGEITRVCEFPAGFEVENKGETRGHQGSRIALLWREGRTRIYDALTDSF